MGSIPSKSDVRITRVAEAPLERTDRASEHRIINITGKISLVNNESLSETDQTTTTKDNDRGPNDLRSTEHGTQIGLIRAVSPDKSKRVAIEPNYEHVISLHRSRQLPTRLPPLHYVEKNEGGLSVEDYDDSGPLKLKMVNEASIQQTVDQDQPSTESLNSCFQRSTIPRPMERDRILVDLSCASPSQSLPATESSGKMRPLKLTPISSSGSGRLGVSGKDLLQQLGNQGIINNLGTQPAESSAIIGELTQLGFLPGTNRESNYTLIYDDNEMKRKVPPRLSKLPQFNHEHAASAKVVHEEKRRRVHGRPRVNNGSVQMNEDVVNNALQRASIRERTLSRRVSTAEERDDTEPLRLRDKFSNVDLL